jgi:adenylate cyclase
MYYTFQQRLAHVLRAILAWVAAYAFLGVLRLYGIGELPHVESVGMLDVQAFVLQLLLAGIITGFLYGSVDIVMDKPRIQRLPYGVILSSRILMHIFIVLVVLVILVHSRIKLGIISEGYFGPDLPGRLSRIIFNKSFYVFVLYFGVVSTILDFFQQVKQKFGRGVFIDIFLGRYHKPKESERIFMFVDLRSSVSLAEQLGHIQYSNLLQDCFFDLNIQLSRYNAKIYQYVGDQVVLHWNVKDGLYRNRCIHCFYGFIDRLEKRRTYYESRYGVFPFFKTGVHMGTVTVSEVGLLKREIAFHGDTVNTTSRIHDFCNKYQQQMLISQNLRDRLNSDDVLELSYIGDHILKGKHISMELFGVKRAKQPVDRQMVNKTLAPARPVDSQHLPPVRVQAASTSSQGSVPSKSRVIS